MLVVVDGDGFEDCEVIKSFEVFFMFVVVGFDVVEGQFYVVVGVIVVDEDLVVVNGVCQLQLVVVVVGLDVGYQVVVGVIGQGDGFGFIFEGYGCQYWIEYFFLCQLMLGWYVVQQGWGLVEIVGWGFGCDFVLCYQCDVVVLCI